MTTLSTHVLNTTTGEPAVGLEVHLARFHDGDWQRVGRGKTDDDGRFAFGQIEAGRHRVGFETGTYGNDMYPFVHVVFEASSERDHYHVPLLLSDYGYTTYRGS